jgi:hypothetical protein
MDRRLPRWVGLLAWLVVLGTVHVSVPVGLSRSGRRWGWRGGRRPAAPNLVGLVPLCAGGALLSSALARHYAKAPGKSWAINRNLEPEYLLTNGPVSAQPQPHARRRYRHLERLDDLVR